MNIKEFYNEIGGNFDEILMNLGKEERILKFVLKFPEEKVLDKLSAALNAKDYETAFREAHNLKGMSINIGFNKLYQVSSDLTESLRFGPKGDVEGLYSIVAEEYNKTCELIGQIQR